MLGSDRQRDLWLKPIQNFNMIGAYAQSELGHGSNVAGLETTAVFDKETDEFVINMQSLTATKYWPGCLGLWSNHSAIFARLLIDGKDYGVQIFMVQLRSMQTHEQLPGVEVGDIGPKLGQTNNDNGYCIL